jgi:hypothetical protein
MEGETAEDDVGDEGQVHGQEDGLGHGDSQQRTSWPSLCIFGLKQVPIHMFFERKRRVSLCLVCANALTISRIS